ncbi:hypothetical protein VMCG_00737 [Cytospora schulzeri]|uniref:Uncharacterized protein n=1 Tax=Cytospora schulzeri TaxID=448051 RepID=A0A423X965_9PEZI|nr:hypothetical protein VMCG_00737 [Valsa malicola]
MAAPSLYKSSYQFFQRLALGAEDEELDLCILVKPPPVWTPERDELSIAVVRTSWLGVAFPG